MIPSTRQYLVKLDTKERMIWKHQLENAALVEKLRQAPYPRHLQGNSICLARHAFAVHNPCQRNFFKVDRQFLNRMCVLENDGKCLMMFDIQENDGKCLKMMENAFLPEDPTTIYYKYPSVGTTPARSLRSPPCNLALHLSNEILRLPQREVVEAMHLATPLKGNEVISISTERY